jgi:hypothetical protein
MPVHPDISIRGGLRQRRKKCLPEREGDARKVYAMPLGQ